jgi:hypothetical protein
MQFNIHELFKLGLSFERVPVVGLLSKERNISLSLPVLNYVGQARNSEN